ncbi:MAG: site-2 protease family protein [Clostridia bacterium]|nr:site-2 protease family protein [Clostridia bacterium]
MFLGLNIKDIVIFVPITLIALSGHELAHAWASTKLGDPTPANDGRLTLNPMAHLDLLGTLLMIATGFGWAKPVMVNPMYYKNRKAGMALVAAAGPISNFIMAFAGIFFLFILHFLSVFTGIGGSFIDTLAYVLKLFAYRNISFMVFNLIPIPPLDGAKVLGMFLPNRIYYTMLQYERYSMILIAFLSLSGALQNILYFGINGVYELITGIFSALAGFIL